MIIIIRFARAQSKLREGHRLRQGLVQTRVNRLTSHKQRNGVVHFAVFVSDLLKQ